ncbi:MAG: ABC transporter ATP-binding protein [Bacteroidetes bacterium]|nr:ABC transporter ATP-binding protein [Bacteroidota bacterium]
MSLTSILSVEGITKRFGKITAVDNLSLNLEQGYIYGLLGPNGSGKTTTLGIILDMIRADAGRYQWFGQPLTKEARKKIGVVFETPQFYPYLTAIQNLRLIATIKDASPETLDELLRLVNLFDRRNSKFITYSLGMKQRLSIAAALIGDPQIMILDEPTNGLDPQGISDIRELIKKINTRGITILLASHLLDEVQKVCTHVTVLQHGKKLFDGKVHDVLAIDDAIEVNADRPDMLRSVLEENENVNKVLTENKLLLVVTKPGYPVRSLHEYLISKGIIVTHLAVRKRSLEKHFLDLLKKEEK